MNTDIVSLHSRMVAGLVKPPKEIIDSLTAEKADMWHMAPALVFEACELAPAIVARDRENALEELGDIEFYLSRIRSVMGIERGHTTIGPAPEAEFAVHAVELCKWAGLVGDQFKKWIIYVKEFNFEATVQALRGLEAQLASCRNSFGFTWGETLQGNYDKLGKRYADHQYSDAAAQERADKK